MTDGAGRRKRGLAVLVLAISVLGLGIYGVVRWRRARPIVIAGALVSPEAIAIDKTNVYFTSYIADRKLRALMKVPLAGGTPTRLAMADMGVPSLAIADGSVLLSAWGDQSVLKVATADGAVAPIATGQRHAYGVAVDGARVIWTARDPTGRSILAAPLGGGPPIVLASGQRDVAVIAADAGVVYWSSGDEIVKLTSGAQNPLPVTRAPAHPLALVVGDGRVFFAGAGEHGGIFEAPVSGGETHELAKLAGRPVGLAVDDERVYVATTGPNGAIFSAPRSGGRLRTLAVDPDGPTALAADAHAVYWTSGGKTGHVLSVRKP